MTLADQHRFLLSNLLQTDGLIEDQLSIFEEHSFVSHIDLPSRKIEIRCYQYQNYFITLIIRMGQDKQEESTYLSNKIKLIFST
ncbi:MAG: hypothetical protein AAF990_09780 [Bacteroidota bacterium]